jgi:hypothetical protein
MKRLATFALALLILASCGSAALQSYLDQAADLHTRFADAALVANRTPRMSLAEVIPDLQEIYREAEDLDAPEDARLNKKKLCDWMDYSIRGYLAFLSQEEDDYIDYIFGEATDSIKQYHETRVELEAQLK